MKTAGLGRYEKIAVAATIPIALALASFAPESESLAQHRRTRQTSQANLYAVVSPIQCHERRVEESLHVEAHGTTIDFDQTLMEQCAFGSGTRFSYSVHRSSIEIRGLWEGLVPPCGSCPFRVSGSIQNVPPGTYDISFVSELRQIEGHRVLTDDDRLVGRASVTVSP